MNARTRISRSLAVFVTGAAITTAGAIFGTANADGASGVFSSLGAGLNVSTNTGTRPAYVLNLDLDGGGTLKTYCIDLNTTTQYGVAYNEATWEEGNVPNLGKVTWVLGHGYPTVTAAALMATINATIEPDLVSLSDSEAAAGTQAAVWHFSDSSNLTGSNPAGVLAVYTYLITNAVSVSEPAPSLAILPATLSGPVGERIGPFTVTTSAASVALLATGGVITDAVGNPLVTVGNGDTFYITIAAEGSVTITGTATATLSSGRVFITTASSPKQKLIAARATTAQVVASVEAQATTTTTTATVPTTDPVPTTDQVEVEPPVQSTTTIVADLPASGRSSASLLAIALGMTMMGGATLMATRRRSI
ncbi:MAG: Cys-Gln thioester bond-forming surface protein [Actinomycetota bacterium]|nr:Cys-Gln thioester bond-forming surface protein [Actinomycetota bacterium]